MVLKLLYTNVIEVNAPWGAEVFMNDALREAGHQTYTVDYRANRYRLAPCFQAAGDFDVFLLQRGDYFPIHLVEAIQRPRFFYFSELFAVQRDADTLFKSNLFDHYFVRGYACRNELILRGWIPEQKLSLLLSSFDPKTYYPNSVEKDIDILFLASVTPRRASGARETNRTT